MEVTFPAKRVYKGELYVAQMHSILSYAIGSLTVSQADLQSGQNIYTENPGHKTVG
jgi:hypothetical protein